MRLTGWMLLAILPAGAALAQQPAADEAARKALAAGEHAKVVAAYEADLKAGTTLSDMAQYRLAIAYSRMGDPVRASAALRVALSANPQGTFATSPARLQQLQTAIAEACAKAQEARCAAPEVTSAPPAPVATPAANEASSAANKPDEQSAPAGEGTVAQQSGSQGQQAQAQVPPQEGQHTAPARAEKQALSVPWTGDLMLAGLAGLAGAGVLTALGTCALRRRRMAPQWQPLVDLRDRTETVIRSLEQSPDGEQTAIYQALQQLLPLLEREVGRSHWRAGASTARLVPADREVVEAAARLSREPLDALKATPDAVRALFQRPVL